MRQCLVRFTGTAPYSASRSHNAAPLPKEDKVAYEERTWQLKAHVRDSQVFIPPMAFKIGLDRAAKMLGRQIPGKGKATYTKYFECGVLVLDPVFIAPESAVECERIHANTDGIRGSGKRVWKNFPRIDDWSGEVTFHIIADEITREIFEEAVTYASIAVGVGRFRPERGGYFGRYHIDRFDWLAA